MYVGYRQKLLRMPQTETTYTQSYVLKKIEAANGGSLEHLANTRGAWAPKYLISRYRVVLLQQHAEPEERRLTARDLDKNRIWEH
jgi:hypothetical protein